MYPIGLLRLRKRFDGKLIPELSLQPRSISVVLDSSFVISVSFPSSPCPDLRPSMDLITPSLFSSLLTLTNTCVHSVTVDG